MFVPNMSLKDAEDEITRENKKPKQLEEGNIWLWRRQNTMVINISVCNTFKEVVVVLPSIEEKVVSRCHLQIVLKTVNACTSLFWIHDGFIGNYSKMIDVGFRKSLQATTKTIHTKRYKHRKRRRRIDINLLIFIWRIHMATVCITIVPSIFM